MSNKVKAKWVIHRNIKDKLFVKARLLKDKKTVEYKYLDKNLFLYGIKNITTVNDFYNNFESVNLTKKCQNCGTETDYKHLCDNCENKRKKALNEIASNVLNFVK